MKKIFEMILRIILYPFVFIIAIFLVFKDIIKNKGLSKLFENAKVRDNIEIEHRDKNGKLIKKTVVSNSIVTIGKKSMVDLLGDVNTIAAFEFIAIGTSSQGVVAGDTLLIAESNASGFERVDASANKSLITQDTTDDTLQIFWTFTNNSGGTIVIEETGLFNVVTFNTVTLLARALTTTQSIANGDTLKITFKIKIA